MEHFCLNHIKAVNSGALHLIFAPMFAGKTTKLIHELVRRADIGIKVLYINHISDERETTGVDNNVTTHSSQFVKLSDKINSIKVSDLSNVNVDNYQVIGIDEAQFFDKSMVNVILNWVDNLGKIVFCAGLDGDYMRRHFGYMIELIPHCTTMIKLNAKCHKCLEEIKVTDIIILDNVATAPFTARIISSKEQMLVGGSDMYVPLCRFHYNLHQK
jgi:thymidine kinase